MRLAGLILVFGAACAGASGRLKVSLNGDWQVGESVSGIDMPASFGHTAPVPGLANLAVPAFQDVDRFDGREFIQISIREKRLPESARVFTAGVPRQERNFFWYRRSFRAGARRPVAMLRVAKAQFGTAVWLNGQKVGEHLGCFSAGYFDVAGAMKWDGDNDLVIRIGAHPAAVPEWSPAGTDFEKYKWTPGIYDNVDLILTGNPYIESVQVAPRLASSSAEIETVLINKGNVAVMVALSHTIEQWRAAAPPVLLKPGERKSVRAVVRMPGAKLWTPETPNLYRVKTAAGADTMETRFGMREFRFDTSTKRAYLNGKPYFLRGSNITLHRFFEDPLCKRYPWEEAWVRKLLVEGPKKMNWNSFRFCIGPAPEMWFDIADEAGLLIQNEFFIWNGREYFPPYRGEELITQYSEWMRDHWNHPSVAIWDASNETDSELLRETVIPAVRKLDLSNRPWDNGYSVPTGVNDPVEDHPYLFSALRRPERSFAMKDLEQMTGAKTTNAGHPSAHAVIANEYGWLWVTRDGTPTPLTEKVYERLIGKDATAGQRFELYAYYLAGLTEFWRAHRNFAGVLHFTWLTSSYPGVKTGDHWKDVEKLELEPNFAEWVRESFKPLGVYINFWQPELKAGSTRTYPVMMVNDLETPARGRLKLEWVGGAAREVEFELPLYGAHTWQVALESPGAAGPAILRATALAEGREATVSRRKVEVKR
ncbi:MAG: hypothetical protein HY858_14340 [Candidatus Solibacter usitatus]|nr:hypothetical protein [Candidatus Solibacter usitatus]